MPDHCDASIRASTHTRDPATCHPDTAPTAGCCCYPGCDQGKCSSFKFDRNIVYQPQSATGVFVGTTFSAGLDNFTFTNNLYWDGNASTTAPMFNSTGSAAEGFSTWQAAGKDTGSILQDPQFVGEGNFTLKDSSPAIAKLGFQPIDLVRLHHSLSALSTTMTAAVVECCMSWSTAGVDCSRRSDRGMRLLVRVGPESSARLDWIATSM
jgi:hypothetical protein